MRVIFFGIRLNMITGNYQPPFMLSLLNLNTIYRTGSVPGPILQLHTTCDLPGLGPAATIIIRLQDKNPSGILACSINYGRLMIGAEIPCRQQQYPSGSLF